MRQEWLIKDDKNNNLLIFFGGWSSTREQIANIVDFDGYNIYIVYDYTTIDQLTVEYSEYTHVAIIAWSLGVYAASQLSLPLNALKIAINGTPNPVNDTNGIPTASFELTIASLARFGMTKFNSRISRGVEDRFIGSSRNVDQLVCELDSIYSSVKSSDICDDPWNYSIVSSGDLIFPPSNQLNYWNKNSIFAPILIDSPHYAFDVECMNILKERLKIDK